MTRTTQYNQYYRLPVAGYGGTLLDFRYPTGQAGLYTPNRNDALVWDTSSNFSGYEHHIDADGFGYGKTGVGWPNAITGDLPAKSTDIRTYEMWGHCPLTVEPTTDRGFRIDFNRVDAANVWVAYFIWHASNYWSTFMSELVGGVWNARGTGASMLTTIDWPMSFHWSVCDMGDVITSSISAYETDDITAGQSVTSYYSGSGRTNKDKTNFIFGWNNTTYTEMLTRGYRITDT